MGQEAGWTLKTSRTVTALIAVPLPTCGVRMLTTGTAQLVTLTAHSSHPRSVHTLRGASDSMSGQGPLGHLVNLPCVLTLETLSDRQCSAVSKSTGPAGGSPLGVDTDEVKGEPRHTTAIGLRIEPAPSAPSRSARLGSALLAKVSGDAVGQNGHDECSHPTEDCPAKQQVQPEDTPVV